MKNNVIEEEALLIELKISAKVTGVRSWKGILVFLSIIGLIL